MKATKTPFFALPRLATWRPEMQSSDWAYYGLTYAKIFGAFTTVGIVAMSLIGPSEHAAERRQHTREPRRYDLNSAWGRS
jgi:hypothetical protein